MLRERQQARPFAPGFRGESADDRRYHESPYKNSEHDVAKSFKHNTSSTFEKFTTANIS
jgi:hypothetical protein